jgi:GT2 family glycosyltransferase
MKNSVAVIVLNWNGWKDTIECLESVFQLSYPYIDVILVDNHSNDQSIEKIKLYCQGRLVVESKYISYSKHNKPMRYIEYNQEEAAAQNKTTNRNEVSLTIIKNNQNYGFAEGNNIGIRFALTMFSPDYILLLNNDAVVEKAFLNPLVDYMSVHPNIGIIGPKILYYDTNKIQTLGVKINFITGHTTSIVHNRKEKENDVLNVDYVYGACFLIRTSVIEKIGLLDPKYFLYNEEADWSLRARSMGYRACCYLLAHVWHKSQASTSKITKYCYYYPIRKKLVSIIIFSISMSFKVLLISLKHRDMSMIGFCVSAIKDAMDR